MSKMPAVQRYHEACVSALDDRQILHKGETDFVLAHLESGMYVLPPPVAFAGSARQRGSQQPFSKTIYRFVLGVFLACPGWAVTG